ncbi:GNAT family N-acetyltransferase [Tunicatimonas pelagia]|uniref:GNAT family N-acetyltransferase n=1 Tax=Tunicatimonas pelagia TaxID=931531 RepID=UPI002665C6E1|nr:GNAT family protein [Tunicatimonas pelagia]WKN41318.1 GNAT family protein [Tunicatimonas pelagia]
MDQKPKLSPVRLDLGDILLRPWQAGDEPSLARHGNNYQIWKNVRDRFPHPYTLKDAQIWVQIANQDPMAINLAIVIEGQVIGAVGVVFKDDVYRRTAEIGYWLGEAHWGQGITTRAVQALSDYVLKHFDVCRLYAGVFEYNLASGRVLKKAGYHLEARLRQSVTKEGRTVDELIYVRLAE